MSNHIAVPVFAGADPLNSYRPDMFATRCGPFAALAPAEASPSFRHFALKIKETRLEVDNRHDQIVHDSPVAPPAHTWKGFQPFSTRYQKAHIPAQRSALDDSYGSYTAPVNRHYRRAKTSEPNHINPRTFDDYLNTQAPQIRLSRTKMRKVLNKEHIIPRQTASRSARPVPGAIKTMYR